MWACVTEQAEPPLGLSHVRWELGGLCRHTQERSSEEEDQQEERGGKCRAKALLGKALQGFGGCQSEEQCGKSLWAEWGGERGEEIHVVGNGPLLQSLKFFYFLLTPL